MKKFRAQQTIEIAIVIGLVVLICLVGIYYFGDSLGETLEDNPILKTFKSSNRTAVQVASSNTDEFSFNVGNINVTSSIAASLGNSGTSTIATTGSSGQVTQTAVTLLDTISKIIDTLSQTSGGNYNNYLSTLANLTASATGLLEANGHFATDDGKKLIEKMQKSFKNTPFEDKLGSDFFNGLSTSNLSTAEQIVKELEFQSDFQKGGNIAKEFNEATEKFIGSMDDSVNKELLLILSKDTLSLASSIEYKVLPALTDKINNYYTNTIKSVLEPSLQEIMNDIKLAYSQELDKLYNAFLNRPESENNKCSISGVSKNDSVDKQFSNFMKKATRNKTDVRSFKKAVKKLVNYYECTGQADKFMANYESSDNISDIVKEIIDKELDSKQAKLLSSLNPDDLDAFKDELNKIIQSYPPSKSVNPVITKIDKIPEPCKYKNGDFSKWTYDFPGGSEISFNQYQIDKYWPKTISDYWENFVVINGVNLNDSSYLGSNVKIDDTDQAYDLYQDPHNPNVVYAMNTEIWSVSDKGSTFNEEKFSTIKTITLDEPASESLGLTCSIIEFTCKEDFKSNLTSIDAENVIKVEEAKTKYNKNIAIITRNPSSVITNNLDNILSYKLDVAEAVKSLVEDNVVTDKELENQINIYKEGNFNELMDSYDAQALCKTLYGDSAKQCN